MSLSKYKSIEPDLVFFGGTFDPPHMGHIEAVRIARDRFCDAQIVVVPSYAPPISKDEAKSPQADFSDRVSLCVIAFDEWDRVQVSSLEEDKESPSYTVKTLRGLKAEYPLSKLAWMIGGDQLSGFQNWRDPKEILEMANLVVVPRPAQVQGNLVEMAASIATSLGFKASIDKEEGVVLLDGACTIFVLKEAPKDISSSEIRKLIAAKSTDIETYIPKPVLEFLNESELYRQ